MRIIVTVLTKRLSGLGGCWATAGSGRKSGAASSSHAAGRIVLTKKLPGAGRPAITTFLHRRERTPDARGAGQTPDGLKEIMRHGGPADNRVGPSRGDAPVRGRARLGTVSQSQEPRDGPVGRGRRADGALS